MKTPVIITDFLRMTDGALGNKGALVASCLKGNAFFPSPSPGLDVLNAALGLYANALIVAQTHDRVRISEKNTCKRNLQAILKNLANYVTAIAGGDRTILLSSGFTVSSESRGPVVLQPISNFMVEQNNISSQATLSADGVKGVRSYSFYYAIADGSTPVWQHITESKASTNITGLVPGKMYSFYMIVVGTKSKSRQSITITRMIY